MWSRVYETVDRPSACLSRRLTAAATCGGFAVEAGDIDRQQTRVLSSNGGAQRAANAGSVMLTAEGQRYTR